MLENFVTYFFQTKIGKMASHWNSLKDIYPVTRNQIIERVHTHLIRETYFWGKKFTKQVTSTTVSEESRHEYPAQP